jgi:predicted nuclease of predicted toxin-antitoxin system
VLRLVLDENISPSIVPLLWEAGVDCYSIRDRDKLRISDHRLFANAIEEGRAVATINRADFERLARRSETHPGIIVIPSGGTRSMQYDYVMRAVSLTPSDNMTDRIFYVLEVGDVRVEIVKKSKAPPAG